MEVLAGALRPQPAAPQKDTSEWLVPFMSQMNQQAQAQAAAQQQMMLSLMQSQAAQQAAAAEAQRQSSQQMMQLMMGKESATEKILMMQLQKAEAQANSPKEDELESFADKLQKMKMVSDMMGGGGGGSLLTELLANADTIGAGAAKIIDAAKGNGLAGAPTAAVAQEQRQIAGAPALPPSAQGDEFPKPSAAVMEAHKVFAKAVDDRDDTETANTFLAYLKELVTAQEPYASMGQRLMKAFQQAEDEGELYTLAKNLWIVVGEKSMRPHAKYAARVLAENYTALHQSIFDEPRTLPEDEELEAEEGDDESMEEEAA
jgi:hypothetical protein